MIFNEISHQLHTDITWISTNFSILTDIRIVRKACYPLFHQEGRDFSQNKGGNDYVFRFGMVLVACDRGGTYHRYPVQGKVYEMVEQKPAGKEKRTAWEMGG